MAENYLAHWGISDVFDESKVVRNAGGQFAKKSSSKLDELLEEGKNLLDSDDEVPDEVTTALSKVLDFFTTNPLSTRTTRSPTEYGAPEGGTYDWEDVPREKRKTGPFGVWHSDDVPDYIGALFVEEGDKEDAGVKGMKWGIRRDRKTLKAEAAKRAGGSAEKKADATKKPPGEETSSARYSRLAAQAKAGKANQMTDADLKFFNARTDALAKVNKLNQTNPSWLSTASKNVLQKTAEQAMQQVAGEAATKFISGPLIEKIKTAGATAAAANSTNSNSSDSTSNSNSTPSSSGSEDDD